MDSGVYTRPDQSQTLAVSGAAPVLDEPRTGTQVGRYLVVDPLGRGGMAVVLRAYDPRLQREVALKIVNTGGDLEAAQRVVREARAMAMLNHPNVVSVYDVEEGTGPDGNANTVVIVMELVDGHDLSGWLGAAKRSTEEILAVFVQAGHGLQVAHEAGLVHRDFKPANVLMGADGRARVTDFGLVHSDGPVGSAGPSGDSIERQPQDRTAPKMVMGTPAFMAPEQHRGDEVDARTDVYAFCAALHEAMYGVRPFAARTLRDLLDTKMNGTRNTGEGEVPAWLERVIARGLAPRPQDRWPSMSRVLAELGRPKDARRRRWAVGTTFGLSAIVVGGVTVAKDRADARCDRAASMDGVWSEDERSDVAAIFEADPRPFTTALGSRVEAELDEYATRWVDLRRARCVGWTETPSSTDVAAISCLDEHRAAMGAAVETLRALDADSLSAAMQAVLTLPALGECSDNAVLATWVRRDLEGDDDVRAEVRAAIRRAPALDSVGKTAQAQALVDDALARAEDLGDPALIAEVMFHQGKLLSSNARYERAAEVLRTAYWTAGTHRRDRLAANVALALAPMLGNALGQFEQGLDWLQHAEMAIARSGERGDVLSARAEFVRASLLDNHFEHEEALAHDRRALELYETALGSDHPRVAKTLVSIAGELIALDRFDEGEDALERAAEIRRAFVGDDHPAVAFTTVELAQLEFAAGRYEAAGAHAQAAIETLEAAFGPRSADQVKARALRAAVASVQGDHQVALREFSIVHEIHQRYNADNPAAILGSHNNLAVAYKNVGDYDQAEAHYRESLEVAERIGGPDGVATITPLINLSRLLKHQGEFEEALRLAERVEEVGRAAYGPNHSRVVNALVVQASTLESLDRLDEAFERYARAVELTRDPETGDRRDAFHGLLGMGEILIERGNLAEAEKILTRASATIDDRTVYDPDRAYLDFAMAKVLVNDPDRVREARTLAQRALDELKGSGGAKGDDAKFIAGWLEEHGPPSSATQ